MSPPVDLNPTTFTRLQAHAVPLVDTIESVINRLLDAYETKGGAPVPTSDDGEASNLRQFNPNTPPDLTHTKVLAIEFDGKRRPLAPPLSEKPHPMRSGRAMSPQLSEC